MALDRLPYWMVPGASFVDATSPDPARHELWHVRGIVDGIAACRRWSREKKRWHYEFWDPVKVHVFAGNLKPRQSPPEQRE